MMRDSGRLAVELFREAFLKPPAMIDVDLHRLRRCEFLIARLGNPNVMIVIHVVGGVLKVSRPIAIDLKISPQCAAKKVMPPEEYFGFLEKCGAMCCSHILELVPRIAALDRPHGEGPR